MSIIKIVIYHYISLYMIERINFKEGIKIKNRNFIIFYLIMKAKKENIEERQYNVKVETKDKFLNKVCL